MQKIMSNTMGEHYIGVVHLPVKFSSSPGVLFTRRQIDVVTLKILRTASRSPYDVQKIGAFLGERSASVIVG